MANLYLTEQGAVVRKTGDRLIVEKTDLRTKGEKDEHAQAGAN